MKNSIRTILVDDEPLALKLMAAKLKKHSQIKIISQCRNGREAIKAINELEPDLIFLDIQMPGISGLEVIKSVQGEMMPLVVFATAYEQYALEAFDANAVDYVLKPIDDDRVARAIVRTEERLLIRDRHLKDKGEILNAINKMNEEAFSSKTANSDSVQPQAVSQVEQDARIHAKIIVKDRDEINILEQSEIAWIDAAGDYICLHVKGQTFIKRGTLKELLSELDENMFKRVHRSTIVNLNYIKKVLPHTKGEFFLLLGEHDKIKVSRNYKEVIKDFLSQK
ncbi:LytR/AlgR family response regulator transcription factor [Glaciecola petra]|uniref:Response regulator n=1 Tax=Glaciecola petra TaxID=3075602 RepID=A0ABU2ZTE8_9ALTE|nr:response regulator [Aestuariibacter sp. P117]MDT0595313.1 response regulator [Aestuariibacter sp. P117]